MLIQILFYINLPPINNYINPKTIYSIMSLAIIGGTVLHGTKAFSKAKMINVMTPYGAIKMYRAGNIYMLPRHGISHNVPPHMINHKANIFALKKLGVGDVISICSTGSLKKDIKPGTIAIPSDYMNIDSISTFYDKKIVHTVPVISKHLMEGLMKSAKDLKIHTKNDLVYLQTRGPRFETKAEINFFKDYADIIGMTMALEADLCAELKIEFAAICSIDNYGNGISKEVLSFEEIRAAAKANSEDILKIIDNIC